MGYLQSVILGLVEGITEYLPISSTFHLIWVSKFLGIPQTEFQKAFEVIIQGGAILAVVVLYFKTFITEKKLVMKVAASFMPTAILGLVLYKIIKGTFFVSYTAQLIVFIVVGIFFIYFENRQKKIQLKKTVNDLTYKDAVIIGLIQVLAVFPGVSRAGAVIVGMMFLGVKRTDAAKYSFLLAVPTLAAASALDLYKSLPVLTTGGSNAGLLVLGFISAFLSALLIVKWFIKYLQNNSLTSFGYYRIITGWLLFLFLSHLLEN